MAPPHQTAHPVLLRWLVRHQAFKARRALPGLALTFALACAADRLARWPWLAAHGISTLTLAIVLGILAGNSAYPACAATAAPGVGLAKQSLLRAGIVLYGLRLTFQDVAQVGMAGVVIDAVMLCSTFALAGWLGSRVFGLDRRTAMLIGAGSAICGAAAVLAAEPVVKGRNEQVTVAISTVVVFGTIAMFVYPALYHANQTWQLLPVTAQSYGIFAGSSIHEVAQVLAAGHAISESAANTAVIAKMVRVMMLAPFLLGLSAWLARHPEGYGAGPRIQPGAVFQKRRQAAPIVIPWFALGFVAMAGLHSLKVLPVQWVAPLTRLDTLLLAMAMAALGLTTHVSAVRQAGVKPLLMAACLFAWLIGGGLVVNLLVARWCA